MNKIDREKNVITKMIVLYCRNHHSTDKALLCDDCRDLLKYSLLRLGACKHGETKTSCKKCVSHCYSPEYQKKIRKVMKYVGPRMIIYHPIDAIRHLISK